MPHFTATQKEVSSICAPIKQFSCLCKAAFALLCRALACAHLSQQLQSRSHAESAECIQESTQTERIVSLHNLSRVSGVKIRDLSQIRQALHSWMTQESTCSQLSLAGIAFTHDLKVQPNSPQLDLQRARRTQLCWQMGQWRLMCV